MDAVKWHFNGLREKDKANREKLDRALRIANRLQVQTTVADLQSRVLESFPLECSVSCAQMEGLVKDARGKYATIRRAKQNEKRSNAIKRRQAHLGKLKTKLRVKAAIASDPDLATTDINA